MLAFGLDVFVDFTVLSLFSFAMATLIQKKTFHISLSKLNFFIFVACLFFYQVFVMFIGENYYPNASTIKLKLLAVLLLFLSIFIFCEELDLENVFKWLFFNSILSSVLFIFLYPLIYYGGKYANPDFIGIYMHVGFFNGLAILIYFFCLPEALAQRKMVSLSGLLLNVFSLFMTGSRAAMVIVGSFLILNFLKDVVMVKNKRRLLVSCSFFVFLVTSASILYISQFDMPFLERTISRLLSLFNSGDSVRVSFIEFALIYPKATEIFFGNGFASYGPLYTGNDVFVYPHNFLIEVLFEGGSISLAVIIFSLVFAMWRLLRTSNKASLVMFSYIICMSLKSYSLVSNRIFFFFLMVALTNALQRTNFELTKSV